MDQQSEGPLLIALFTVLVFFSFFPIGVLATALKSLRRRKKPTTTQVIKTLKKENSVNAIEKKDTQIKTYSVIKIFIHTIR